MTDYKNDSILLIEDSRKNNFITNLRKTNPLINIKILGIKEFERLYYFDYTNEAVYYISKKYNVIKSIAEIYIKNLYQIKPIDDEKVRFLETIKQDLIDNKLLIINNLFIKSIYGKTIYIYELHGINKYYDRMFDELSKVSNIKYIESEPKDTRIQPLYRLRDKDMEIEFVASKIAELLKNGIDINKIKLSNVSDDYQETLKRIFKDFHIPIELTPKESIYSTNLVHTFIELYSSDIEETMKKLREQVSTNREETIYKSILNIVNSYCWCEDYNNVKEYILDDIRSIKIPTTKLTNSIKVIDFLNYDISDDEYIFLINFNLGVFPNTVKDEDYLNDEIKTKLGVSTSVDNNKFTIFYTRKKIQETKNLIVTCAKRNIDGELYISSAYQESLFEEKNYERSFIHSNSHNLKELIQEKDEYRKYGTKTSNLKTLQNHYKDAPYLDYDNSFKGIDKTKINDFLNNKLTLSYSSMNTYYMCSFRYYLDNILKMDKFEDTFEIMVGNIFHRVLSFAFKDDFDFEDSWDKALEETEHTFNIKEQFFLTILKPELRFIISSIDEGMEYTELKDALYEQKIIVNIDDNTIFKGFVDKILYKKFDTNTIAVIIDYKTGNPELKLDNVIYGLDMQLPIYAYLLEHHEGLKDAEIGGFYLQKILNNINSPIDKKEALKLQGYSNSDISILEHVDSSYNSSEIIKSLKTTQTGFSSYSKILSTDEINKLKTIVESKIKEASINIKNAKFDINPKELRGQNYGCKFCKYRDICYMTTKDIVKLKQMTKEDFLGGDD